MSLQGSVGDDSIDFWPDPNFSNHIEKKAWPEKLFFFF